MLGIDATALAQYSEVHSSNTLYIATINVTNSAFYGQWALVLTSQGPYSIQVLGDGELTFLSEITVTHPNITDDINDLKPLEGGLTSTIIKFYC